MRNKSKRQQPRYNKQLIKNPQNNNAKQLNIR